MKKLLRFTLAFVFLAAFAGMGAAQQKAEDKKSPAAPAPRLYAPGDAHYGTPKKEVSGIESETSIKAKPPTGVEEKQRAPARVCANCYVCKCNTGSAGCLCDSAVRSVDDKAKTISLQRKDGSVIVLDASRLTSLPKAGRTAGVQYIDVGGKPVVQSVTVCSGGHWWTITWGGMTQGGSCSVEGAIK